MAGRPGRDRVSTRPDPARARVQPDSHVRLHGPQWRSTGTRRMRPRRPPTPDSTGSGTDPRALGLPRSASRTHHGLGRLCLGSAARPLPLLSRAAAATAAAALAAPTATTAAAAAGAGAGQ
jgi:hypothetical protein